MHSKLSYIVEEVCTEVIYQGIAFDVSCMQVFRLKEETEIYLHLRV